MFFTSFQSFPWNHKCFSQNIASWVVVTHSQTFISIQIKMVAHVWHVQFSQSFLHNLQACHRLESIPTSFTEGHSNYKQFYSYRVGKLLTFIARRMKYTAVPPHDEEIWLHSTLSICKGEHANGYGMCVVSKGKLNVNITSQLNLFMGQISTINTSFVF